MKIILGAKLQLVESPSFFSCCCFFICSALLCGWLLPPLKGAFHPFIFFEVIFPLIALLPEVPSIGLSLQENIDNTQRAIRSWTELPRGSRRPIITIVRAHGMIMSRCFLQIPDPRSTAAFMSPPPLPVAQDFRLEAAIWQK